MPIRFGSVCSGIEAASVAWGPLGWEAAWLSEIEPFPCALLAHYYPNVPNLGDMTTIKDRILRGEVEAPDVFCGGTPCFTAGHLVLTETGYKPIETIQVGEKVITHKGRLRPVLRVGHKQAEVGELSLLGSDPIICTPNHPFLSHTWTKYRKTQNGTVMYHDQFSELEWTPAERMPGRRWLSLTSYEKESVDLPSHIFGGSCEKLMFFIGMWLGDGCFRKSPNKTPVTVLSLNDTKLEAYKQVFGDFGHIRKNRSIYTINITNMELYSFLKEQFGEYSHGKHIPTWVLSHSNRKDLLQGYFITDGSKSHWGYKSASVSKSLAYGISDLAATLGFVCNAHSYTYKNGTQVILGRLCRVKPVTEVRSVYLENSRLHKKVDNFLSRKVRGYTPLHKEDTVYNIEVEEDHSYIVNSVIAHNCQSFSLAGLRKSLGDSRGNLTLHFVEIANAIDHVRSLRGDKPVTIFWENVIGVLNTDDNAFGCFLGAIVGLDVPIPAPSENGFPTAGRAVGPKRHAAWRVLDAQYFGVPQRRRRVFVVASARDKGGVDPAEILFERPGVQGDFSESRTQGQGSASGATRSAPSDDSGPIQTLVAGYSKSYNSLQELDKLQISAFRESSFGGYEQDKVSSTLKAVGGALSGGSETFVSQKDNTPPPKELPKSHRNTDRE